MENGKMPTQRAVGRGATINPANRFERVRLEVDWEQLEGQEVDDERPAPRTMFFEDDSQTLIAETDSPDVPFRYSINPYRGCEHGCAYCYARPYHEMLGMNAGLDFETKILVKLDAPRLLRRELGKPNWQGEVICVSGVTDCYQPAERGFRLTRALLEIMLEARQAVAVTTKNSLVLRDLDLLAPLAAQRLAQANISIPTLDAELARRLEPRTATPAARLRAIRQLTEAGVPVRVLIAPIIPGLTDHQVPQVMQAAKEAGAVEARYVLLRLPWSVAPVFLAWLETHYARAKPRIEQLIRSTRQGRLNDAAFGDRMIGRGAYAESIRSAFLTFARKYGLDGPLPAMDTTLFRPPRSESGQRQLF
jgi:DNA repair photolyase